MISLKTPSQCADLALALASVDVELLRRRYFTIAPENYGQALTDEDFEYTFSWFSGLPAFYRKAADAKRHVIFTVDF